MTQVAAIKYVGGNDTGNHLVYNSEDCVPIGELCGNGPPCCSGNVCYNPGYCHPHPIPSNPVLSPCIGGDGGEGVSDGGTCSYYDSSDCCSGICDLHIGINDFPVRRGMSYYSGDRLITGTCRRPPPHCDLIRLGEFCTDDADCCSGICESVLVSTDSSNRIEVAIFERQTLCVSRRY
jgi:hypothetical protein